MEPHTFEGRRRKYIRLVGSGGRGHTSIDYDVKVYSLVGNHVHPTTTRKPAETPVSVHASLQCQKYLTSVARKADVRRPWAAGDFKPLVFSLGGLMETVTAEELANWKKEMTEFVYEAMIRRVSLLLLRARAKVYEG